MNKAAPSLFERLHHRLGWLGMGLLMLPCLAWVWLAASGPVWSVFSGAVPRYVLDGRAFREPFDIVHAGFAMDQPTIGKWLFWFSVMVWSSVPYAVLLAWLGNRRTKAGWLAYACFAFLLATCLLCLLSWPSIWLVQYVRAMGWTPRRAAGLAYCALGALAVLSFVIWAVRRPRMPASAALREDSPRHATAPETDGPPLVCLSPADS